MTAAPRIEWDFRVTISDILQIFLILVMIAAGWYKFDNRIGSVERIQQQQTETLHELTDTARKSSRLLDTLQTRFETFPLHRHVGRDIVYPDGHVETPATK